MSTQDDIFSLDRIRESLEQTLPLDTLPLKNCLQTITVPSLSSSPGKTTIECHFLKVDSSGRPRLRELIEIIVARLIDYTIPRKKIEAAKRQDKSSNSTAAIMRLSREARSLLTSLAKTGEGGELLLFVLAEYYLRYPQVIAKMHLKTDSNMHIHGADGVFLGVVDDTLSLFWGESKVYADFNSALTQCIKSLNEILKESESVEREFSLIKQNIDLNDKKLEDALLSYFDYESPLYEKLLTSGICLIAFNYDEYKVGGELTNDHLEAALTGKIADLVESVSKKIDEHMLSMYHIHTFLIPIECSQSFRDVFLAEV